MCSLPSVWHSSFLKRKKRKRERKPAEARLRRIRVAAVGWRMHCFLASLRSWSTLLSCCEIVPVTQSVCALLPRSITHPSKLGRRHLAAAAFRLEVQRSRWRHCCLRPPMLGFYCCYSWRLLRPMLQLGRVPSGQSRWCPGWLSPLSSWLSFPSLESAHPSS